MHANDVGTTADQVRRLVDAQFPQWADLPITPVREFGTDHLLYRLGEELLVRMPRIEDALDQVATDARWLPVLAPRLPVVVPEQLAAGRPGEDYPWGWSVVRWIPGTAPEPCSVASAAVGRDLGRFVTALREVDSHGGPVKTGLQRGVPLANRDRITRDAVDELGSRVERDAVLAIWQDAVEAPPWSGESVWLHGDLKAGNLVIDDDRLTGVIDFGALGLGDPAADLTPAWLALQQQARQAFRRAAGLDDAAWRRGRGWALSVSLIELPYYWDRSPAIAEGAQRAIAAILAERGD